MLDLQQISLCVKLCELYTIARQYSLRIYITDNKADNKANGVKQYWP